MTQYGPPTEGVTTPPAFIRRLAEELPHRCCSGDDACLYDLHDGMVAAAIVRDFIDGLPADFFARAWLEPAAVVGGPGVAEVQAEWRSRAVRTALSRALGSDA